VRKYSKITKRVLYNRCSTELLGW